MLNEEEWWQGEQERIAQQLDAYRAEELENREDWSQLKEDPRDQLPWTVSMVHGDPNSGFKVYVGKVHAPDRTAAVLCCRRMAALDLLDGEPYLFPLRMVGAFLAILGHHDVEAFCRDR